MPEPKEPVEPKADPNQPLTRAELTDMLKRYKDNKPVVGLIKAAILRRLHEKEAS